MTWGNISSHVSPTKSLILEPAIEGHLTLTFPGLLHALYLEPDGQETSGAGDLGLDVSVDGFLMLASVAEEVADALAVNRLAVLNGYDILGIRIGCTCDSSGHLVYSLYSGEVNA
jgi:hypothetical protein